MGMTHLRYLDTPGHWNEGNPNSQHSLGTGCDECDVHRLSQLSWDDVKAEYLSGHISVELFNAYVYVHITYTESDPVRDSGKPTDQRVLGLVELILNTYFGE